jgi:hypothetical protein
LASGIDRGWPALWKLLPFGMNPRAFALRL